MKSALMALTIVLLLTSCSNNPKTANVADTANRTMYDRSQAIQMNGVSDTLIGSDGTKYIKAPANSNGGSTPVVITPAPNTTTTITTRSNTSTHSTAGSGKSHHSSGSGATGSNTTTSAQPQKKGWSKAAKGAVIGGATGAVAGAIISKKKGTGAVVGGLLGAGAGYMIGRGKDKKDGRVKQ